jgi:hypothetical protein
MHPLTSLICGSRLHPGAIGQVMAHLRGSLDCIIERSYALRASSDPVETALFGPVLGRAILEVSLTAICGRFDPYRILAIRQSQLVPEFDIGKRNPLAFNWSFDVTGEEKPKDWSQKIGTRDLQRALLSPHFQDLVWREAFSRLLDDVPVDRGLDWMGRLRQYDPDGFTTRMRADADRLFSELSKGVHHEFVIPRTNQYDKETVRDLLVRCWELAATLGITAYYSPIVDGAPTHELLDCYEQAQRDLALS